MADLNDAIQHRIDNAPLPTKQTLRARQNPFTQFFRFIFFNLKMLRVVFK
ncbi:MAG: hypothetical protein WAN89_03370 [Lawsonella sp.]|nr:hypothetical protein [Mycobacteriales bacterium]